MNIFLYVISGLFSGVVAGMGMGGGTLLIPVLTIFFSIAQKIAQGVNLIAFIPTAIVALIIHCKNKLVDFKVGLQFLYTGVIFSIVGAIVATNLSGDILKILFACFLLIIGIFQLLHIIKSLYLKSIKKKMNLIKNYYSIKYYAISKL